MLVTFETKYYPPITMLGEVAVRLLRDMGCSGEVPGALKAGDVRNALDRMRRRLVLREAHSTESSPAEDDDEKADDVSLSIRAFPLMELMSLAAENGSDVLWKERRQ